MSEPDAPKQPSAPPAGAPGPAAEAQPFAATLRGVWARIRQHKVVQWTLAYLAVAYTLLHGAEMLGNSFGWSHGLVRTFTWILVLGIPVVITLAWYHGARGQQRASGTEVMIIAILLALGGALLWRDTADHEQAPDAVTATTPAPAVALPQAPVAPDDKSIAVLPFADMSPAKDQEYMADGIAEELLNLLAQVPNLKVIARTSSFAFKGKEANVAEIAKTLSVAHVLEGSVRKSGNKLRITAQLVRAADSTQLWSQNYDRSMDDIFAVQDEIANAIVQALRIKLAGGTLNRREGGTQNLEAYQLYLRAVTANYLNTKASLDAAVNYAEQAIKIDPNYGRAWSVLSWAVAFQTDNGFLPAKEGYERARQMALHALQLSAGLAEAHALLSYIYQPLDWNWAGAEAELQLALAIDPTDPLVLLIAGVLSTAFGHWDEAERQYRAALVRDPLNPWTRINLGNAYYLAGRFTEAEETYRELLERQPDFSLTRRWLSKTLLAQGKPEAALTVIQQETDEANRQALLPVALDAVGRRAEADEALNALMARWGESWPSSVAQAYAYRGDHDRALEWLERAYQQSDTGLTSIVGEPLFKGMADDPRYKAFLRKMKLPE